MMIMVDRKDDPESINDLKEELSKLREEVRRISEAAPSKTATEGPPQKPNLGQTIGDYVNEVVQSVMSGITSEIDKSVFVDPTGVWFDRHIAKVQSRSLSDAEAGRAASLMSAMASEHRLRILTELLYGGRYERNRSSAEGYHTEHNFQSPEDSRGGWTCGSRRR